MVPGIVGGDQKVRDFLSCVLQYMSSRQQQQQQQQQGHSAEQANNGQRVSEWQRFR